jgi:hypothetical protein
MHKHQLPAYTRSADTLFYIKQRACLLVVFNMDGMDIESYRIMRDELLFNARMEPEGSDDKLAFELQADFITEMIGRLELLNPAVSIFLQHFGATY